MNYHVMGHELFNNDLFEEIRVYNLWKFVVYSWKFVFAIQTNFFFRRVLRPIGSGSRPCGGLAGVQGFPSLRTSPLLNVRRRSATFGVLCFLWEMWEEGRFLGFFGVCGSRFFQKLSA